MNRKIIFIAVVWVVCVLRTNAQRNILSTNFPENVLNKVLIEKKDYYPLPQYKSMYWKDSIPDDMKKNYIQKGEQYLNKKWNSLPVRLFSEYQENGDRNHYQNVIFEKRNQLMSLALAEIMEAQGRFMNDIIDGIISLCEETWWGIPAHYPLKVPDPQLQVLDLFNAETGGMLSWIYYIFEKEFDNKYPQISKRIEQEIQRRILDPGMNHNDWWRTSVMNWNPWICSNWLACVLLADNDRQSQLMHLNKIFKCLDTFIDGYPTDGGCDEGPNYWGRATGSLCDCLSLLYSSTQGKIDLSHNYKIQLMCSYLCKMYIGKKYCVNFADSSPFIKLNVNCLFNAALYTNNKALMDFAALTAKESSFYEKTADRDSSLLSISRELNILSNLKKINLQGRQSVFTFDSFLPFIQVVTARSDKNSTKGLFFAAKGGTNGESHNHNDVGSFILYNDANPVLIDPGVGTYRKETFNDSTRYKIWTMQSQYHNLPCINGYSQSNGVKFAAQGVYEHATDRSVIFSLDISKAYMAKTNVDYWKRIFRFERGRYLEVCEEYKLLKYLDQSYMVFITPLHPIIHNDCVELNSGKKTYQILFDKKILTPTSEEINLNDYVMQKNWGKLYRIKLFIKDKRLSQKIFYRIIEKAPQ